MSLPMNTGGDPDYKPGEYSEAQNSTITTPDEDKKKEEKARVLIDQIVSERLQPIEAQLAELPSLIQSTVIDVITQLQNQNQTQQQPVNSQQANPQNLAVVAELAKALGPILGKSENTGSNPNTMIMDMIVQSYMKRMQMDIDSQFMNTYQKPVDPPQWLRDRNAPNQRPKVEVE